MGSNPVVTTKFYPGMREIQPQICWRMITPQTVCIKDRGHDGNTHEGDELVMRWVVRVEGLPDGKGAVRCNSPSELFMAVEDLAVKRLVGEAGDRLVIERC